MVTPSPHIHIQWAAKVLQRGNPWALDRPRFSRNDGTSTYLRIFHDSRRNIYLDTYRYTSFRLLFQHFKKLNYEQISCIENVDYGLHKIKYFLFMLIVQSVWHRTAYFFPTNSINERLMGRFAPPMKGFESNDVIRLLRQLQNVAILCELSFYGKSKNWDWEICKKRAICRIDSPFLSLSLFSLFLIHKTYR